MLHDLLKQALRHAPANSEMDVNLVATLYVNRASTMHVTYCSHLFQLTQAATMFLTLVC